MQRRRSSSSGCTTQSPRCGTSGLWRPQYTCGQTTRTQPRPSIHWLQRTGVEVGGWRSCTSTTFAKCTTFQPRTCGRRTLYRESSGTPTEPSTSRTRWTSCSTTRRNRTSNPHESCTSTPTAARARHQSGRHSCYRHDLDGATGHAQARRKRLRRHPRHSRGHRSQPQRHKQRGRPAPRAAENHRS